MEEWGEQKPMLNSTLLKNRRSWQCQSFSSDTLLLMNKTRGSPYAVSTCPFSTDRAGEARQNAARDWYETGCLWRLTHWNRTAHRGRSDCLPDPTVAVRVRGGTELRWVFIHFLGQRSFPKALDRKALARPLRDWPARSISSSLGSV